MWKGRDTANKRRGVCGEPLKWVDQPGIATAEGGVCLPGPSARAPECKVHREGTVPDGPCVSPGIWVPPPAIRSFLVVVSSLADEFLMYLWGRKWSPHPTDISLAAFFLSFFFNLSKV